MRKKEIMVNGVKYTSIREAARFIAKNATPERNPNTIVKELRTLWKGRAPWKMYDEYLVQKAD